METFVWVVAVLIGLSTIGKLLWLAKSEFPQRTAKTETADVVVNVALLIWAAALIAA